MFLFTHTLHYQYSQWHLKLLWLRHYLHGDRLRRWALVVAITLIAIIGVQFLYPSSLALPQTRISGAYFGFHTKDAIAGKVDKFNNQKLTIATETQKLQILPAQAGITIDGGDTAARAVQYTWRERLIPLSLLFSKKYVDSYSFSVNSQLVETFAKELQAQNKPAKDAKLKIDGTSVVIEAGENGYNYDKPRVQSQLEASKLTNKLEAKIAPTVFEPNLPTAVAEGAAVQANKRIATPFTIEAAGETIVVDAKTMASWIVVNSDTGKKTMSVDYDRTKIKSKLLSLSSKVYIASANNTVTIVDGETRGSSAGSSGQALMIDATIDEIIRAARTNATQVTGKVQAVTPSTKFVRSYTRTSKGLQALINYWTQTHGGNYGISLRSVDGSISASHNGGKKFTSASIYKLYLAYVVYSKVDAGTLSLGSVESCIDAMIVRSDNDCAVSLGDMVGWSANDGMLHSKGYGSTTLTRGGHLTTANDTATWLTHLANGSLSTGDHNSSLLSMMRRQIYRSGIPAGARGSSVANKVGFLGGLNHDAAIVYGPKGTYVLSVMSSGSSFGQISDLASQITAVMNQ